MLFRSTTAERTVVGAAGAGVPSGAEIVVWASFSGRRRGMGDRNMSREDSSLDSASDGAEDGKKDACKALAVPAGMSTIRRLGNGPSCSARAPCSVFTIS